MIIDQCSEPSFAEMPRKRPGVAFPYVLPYLAMRRNGHTIPYFDDTLEFLASLGHPYAFEVAPYRELDARYFLHHSGLDDREPEWESLVDRTFLGRATSHVYIDAEASYSLTHTLFYVSDFGRIAPRLSAERRVKAAAMVQSLLIHYWRTGHLDLLGELLIVARAVGVPATIVTRAAEAFLSFTTPDGCIPGERSWQSDDDDARCFAACYHTTIVSLLYCCLEATA